MIVLDKGGSSFFVRDRETVGGQLFKCVWLVPLFVFKKPIVQ